MEVDLTKEKVEDEISLIDLFAMLWCRKVMIIVITAATMIGMMVFAIISLVLPPDKSPLPNQYTPQALMLINNSSSSGGGLSSMIGLAGLGGLAGLAGVSTRATHSDLAISLLRTNTVLDAVVNNFDMINRYKIDIEKSPRADSRKTLKKLLVASYDETSGIFTISFTDKDPEFAQSVVNFSVLYLEQRFNEMGIDKNKIEKENLEINIANAFKEIQNLEQETHRLGRGTLPSITLEINRLETELGVQRQVYAQLKVQYEMLKVTMASEKPTFQILEMAEVPDQKSGPSRGLICIIVTSVAGFFSVFLAFVLNAIANIKKNPEAMAKLRGDPQP